MQKLLLASLALCSLCTAFDYCTISPQNTMCLYQPGVLGSACVSPVTIAISEADKATILAAHNNYRRKIAKGQETSGSPGPQPAAADMQELTWDDELQLMAQTWANQCKFQHDPNRNVARFYVGQNLYTSYSSVASTTADWNGAITSWYNEVANMDPAYVNTFPQTPAHGTIGHYTQLVWANTTKVGCGIIGFYNSAQPSYPYQVLVACDYGAGGNFLSRPVYKVGTAATQCPVGTVPSDGLCA